MTVRPQRFPFDDDIGIDADRRVVDEDATVHIATSTRSPAAVHDDGYRLFEVQGQAEILGEMIESAKRKDAERDVRPDQFAGNAADGTVATASDHDRCA